MALVIAIFFFIFISVLTYNVVIKEKEKLSQIKIEKIILKKEKKKQSFFEILIKFVSPVSKSSLPVIKRYRENIEKKLNLSGKKEEMNFEKFITLQISGIIIFGILFLLIFESLNLFIILISIATGIILPVLWLDSEVQKRQKNIFKSLPDMIDLMALSMAAGLDFNSALNKYIEKVKKGILYEELLLVQKEMQLGKTRIEALNSFAERVNHPAVINFVTSVVQGIQLGSSLTPVLKGLSEALRTERLQFAEKIAAETPTKILFPLVLFIFPTIFIILFGPIILMFIGDVITIAK